MENTVENESRSALRLPFVVQVQMRWSGQILSAYCTDISETGIFLQTREPVEVGEHVHLVFQVFVEGKRQLIEFEGSVARRVDTRQASVAGSLPGLGIQFSKEVRGRHELAKFLTLRISKLQEPVPKAEQPGLDQETRAFDGSASPQPGGSKRPESRDGLAMHWGTSPKLDHKGFLTSLSEPRAFFVETSQPAPTHSHIYLWFELPLSSGPRPVKATGKVVWQADTNRTKGPGMAISIEVATLDTELIRNFLERRKRSYGSDTGSFPQDLGQVMEAAVKDTVTQPTRTVRKPQASLAKRLIVALLFGASAAVAAATIFAKLLS